MKLDNFIFYGELILTLRFFMLIPCRFETSRESVAKQAQRGKTEATKNQVHCLSTTRNGDGIQPNTIHFTSETSVIIKTTWNSRANDSGIYTSKLNALICNVMRHYY